MTKCINLGIDTGGTFTDFFLFDGQTLRIHKVLSTPDAPERAILQGINDLGDLGLVDKKLRLVHGSTVATNAVLERKGARTVFVTNKGFRDVLIIGRQARRELYNLTPIYVAPIVDQELCVEVSTRLAADGSLLCDIDDEEIRQLIRTIADLEPDAVAVSLLFSFLDDRQEQAIRAAIVQDLADDLFVSISSEILPEYKEYERGITTWLNAYVGPLVQGYLQRMEQQLPAANISIMQSSGSTCSADLAGQNAVNLLLSGPAGGLEGARFISKLAGYKQLITLDMGGTSTDVSLINDAIVLTSEGKIGDLPVSVPMVDIHTIGAGGGSIAWVDEGSLLQVGPQSAGADPGPACYGNGGEQVTVTDANVILGRLPASTQLGGEMRIDKEAARSRMNELADQLGLDSAEAVASGVIRIANEHMAAALRVISVQKGHDPADFVLVSFGGAGGLHVCDLAEAMNMRSALVPVHAGVLSALGMLAARPGRELSKTLAVPLAEQNVADLETEFAGLLDLGVAALIAEGLPEKIIETEKSLDLCYKGQSFTLNIEWSQDLSQAIVLFHEAHEQRYGHQLSVPVELINIRVSVKGKTAELSIPSLAKSHQKKPVEQVKIYGVEEAVDVWHRQDLVADQLLTGPAIIMEAVSTTYVATGWCCRVDQMGNLHLTKTKT